MAGNDNGFTGAASRQLQTTWRLRHPMTVDGIKYNTVTALYEASRFLEDADRRRVAACPSAVAATDMSRILQNGMAPQSVDFDVEQSMTDAITRRMQAFPDDAQLLVSAGPADGWTNGVDRERFVPCFDTVRTGIMDGSIVIPSEDGHDMASWQRALVGLDEPVVDAVVTAPEGEGVPVSAFAVGDADEVLDQEAEDASVAQYYGVHEDADLAAMLDAFDAAPASRLVSLTEAPPEGARVVAPKASPVAEASAPVKPKTSPRRPRVEKTEPRFDATEVPHGDGVRCVMCAGGYDNIGHQYDANASERLSMVRDIVSLAGARKGDSFLIGAYTDKQGSSRPRYGVTGMLANAVTMGYAGSKTERLDIPFGVEVKHHRPQYGSKSRSTQNIYSAHDESIVALKSLDPSRGDFLTVCPEGWDKSQTPLDARTKAMCASHVRTLDRVLDAARDAGVPIYAVGTRAQWDAFEAAGGSHVDDYAVNHIVDGHGGHGSHGGRGSHDGRGIPELGISPDSYIPPKNDAKPVGNEAILGDLLGSQESHQVKRRDDPMMPETVEDDGILSL